jgi:hypothetical protein
VRDAAELLLTRRHFLLALGAGAGASAGASRLVAQSTQEAGEPNAQQAIVESADAIAPRRFRAGVQTAPRRRVARPNTRWRQPANPRGMLRR